MSIASRLHKGGSVSTILLICCCMAAAPLLARENGKEVSEAETRLPKGLIIDFQKLTHTEDGELLFTGPVTITWRKSRIQADELSLRSERYVSAEGNVLVIWGGNRIFGSGMDYDLETERGEIRDAFGQIQSDYYFWARRAEKIGEDQVRLKKATVTTCTQPVPYWSFSVSSATIRVDHYARMWNVRLRARKLPMLYIPYLVWPVKQDRAAGLLMPEFHTTQNRGRAISQDLFIPIGRSADLTLMTRYYTGASYGGGGEIRFVPNSKGAGSLYGFYIKDEVENRGRYRASYNQTQQFQNGFRMVADINLLSDFNYYSDFERALHLVSSPTILARLEFSRNGPWTSMNVRQLRREQLRRVVTDPADDSGQTLGEEILIQQTFPEIEWRGRSRKLGKTPFYFSYQSSFASIQQREKLPVWNTDDRLNVDYFRGDLFPAISLPLSPTPWLDITPRVDYRTTYYTQSQTDPDTLPSDVEREILDEDIWRHLWSAGIDIVGPKLFKIYERPNSSYSARYKHTVEPRISYGYVRGWDRDAEIILYDEVDRSASAGNLLTYAIVQRLFAKRPRSRPSPAPTGLETILLPDGTTSEAGEPEIEHGDTATEDQDVPYETIEIATLELRQSRTFDEFLQSDDHDNDPSTPDITTKYSNLQLIGRFNPGPETSFDLRGSYSPLYHSLDELTFSGTMRKRQARLRVSLVHRQGLGLTSAGDAVADDTQLRLTTGFSMFRGKLQFDINASYDYDPPVGQDHIRDKQWRMQYKTQCCTFTVERLARNFSTFSDRQDYYFRIDLRGVGKLLSMHY